MRDHVILNYLDQPLKFFLWPASTVVAVVSPTLILMLFGRPLLGLGLSILVAGSTRMYRKYFGERTLIGLSYWALPHQKDLMPMTPPSHIREFIG